MCSLWQVHYTFIIYTTIYIRVRRNIRKEGDRKREKKRDLRKKEGRGKKKKAGKGREGYLKETKERDGEIGRERK